MVRKYCPICYFEFRDKVELEMNGHTRPMDWEGRSLGSDPGYKCVKRGHVSKGSGLSLEELERLFEFRKLKI